MEDIVSFVYFCMLLSCVLLMKKKMRLSSETDDRVAINGMCAQMKRQYFSCDVLVFHGYEGSIHYPNFDWTLFEMKFSFPIMFGLFPKTLERIIKFTISLQRKYSYNRRFICISFNVSLLILTKHPFIPKRAHYQFLTIFTDRQEICSWLFLAANQ